MDGPVQEPKDNQRKSRADKGTGEVIGELWALVKDYAKQETVDPLKRLGRFVGFGAPGSILLGLGGLFIMLGALRALQTETGRHLTGSLTWVPYAATFVVTALFALFAVKAIGRTRKGRGAADTEGTRA